MQRGLILFYLAVLMLLGASAQAATGRVIKVLPHFLDKKGHHTLTPSLYDRDAYQAYLREHPDERSGLRYDIQWKTTGPVWEPLTLRVELRGTAQGQLPKEVLIEKTVLPGGFFSHWTGLTLLGQDYKLFGEVTAWRVTLWEGEELLGEQKSFLW